MYGRICALKLSLCILNPQVCVSAKLWLSVNRLDTQEADLQCFQPRFHADSIFNYCTCILGQHHSCPQDLCHHDRGARQHLPLLCRWSESHFRGTLTHECLTSAKRKSLRAWSTRKIAGCVLIFAFIIALTLVSSL